MKSTLDNIDFISRSPGGVALLRKLVLELAVRGKLVSQDPKDETASVLLERIKQEKARLVKEEKLKAGKEFPEITEEEKPYELPRGWEWVRLGDISSYIQRGKGPDYVNESPIQVIDQKCVRWDGLDLSYAKYISEESFALYDSERILQSNDILWNSTGTGTIGRACVVVGDQVSNQLVCDSHVTVIRLLAIEANYIVLWLRSTYIFDNIESIANGSTNQIELATSAVLTTVVPLPPLPEQIRIVARVQELMAVLNRLEGQTNKTEEERNRALITTTQAVSQAIIPEEIASSWLRLATNFDHLVDRAEDIKTIRNMVLKLAVRGKLVSQDPKDEPTSVILERIQQEKARLVKEGKIKAGKVLPEIMEEEKPDELPLGWKWVRVRDITHDWGQKIPSSDFTYIDVASIENKAGRLSLKLETLSAKAAPSRARKIVKEGSVIYSTVRPYLLNTAIIENTISPEPIASTAFCRSR